MKILNLKNVKVNKVEDFKLEKLSEWFEKSKKICKKMKN